MSREGVAGGDRVVVASTGSVLPPAPIFGLFELLGEHVQMTPSSAIYLPRSRNLVKRLPFKRDMVVDAYACISMIVSVSNRPHFLDSLRICRWV
jgi:hypothetical protein